jgi:MFS family permease
MDSQGSRRCSDSNSSMSSEIIEKDHELTLEQKDIQDDLVTSSSSIDPEQTRIDSALDKRISRKLDTHILPWLFGIWFFAFIERSNIGNAKITGLTTDLDLDGVKFNIALTVFYILYILVDVPSNLIVKRVGAGHYLPAIMFCWGIVGTLMGLTKSYAGLIVCRLLLGLCEGGMFGGVILYISMFYPRHQMSIRLGIWYCAAPLSGALGGLLAAGLSQISYGGYNSWPWIFIIEGVITCIFGATAFFFLPHTPSTARFLSEEEKSAAVARLHHDLSGASSNVAVDQEKFSKRWVSILIP